jgi:GTP-binding nuclear protein Ran
MNSIDTFFRDSTKSILKVVLLGDGATGKSSFFERISKGDTEDYRFNKKYNATTGCDICVIPLTVNGQNIDIHLFDTAGQEKFGQLRDSYILGADGAVIMYDITNSDTRQNVLKWVKNIKDLSVKTSTTAPNIIVCGNKSDLRKKCGPSETYVFRTATLQGHYPLESHISTSLISAKSGENLWDGLNILIKSTLGLWGKPTIKIRKD